MKPLVSIFLSTISVLLISSTSLAVQDQITGNIWNDNPKIKEIRDRYQEISKFIEAGIIEKQNRKFEYCEPYQDTERILFTDKNKTVRSFSYTSGSGDSVVTYKFFYDAIGSLRFALIEAGAFNGTKIRHHIYFNETGKRIGEIQNHLEGPGYTFPKKKWPEASIIFEPLKAYNADNKCNELINITE